ncbi:MAG: hypothetical protein ABI629_18015, partial [bacterium]
AAARAAAAGDAAGLAASGLMEFTSALARFASSDKRQVAALREAGKRAVRWIEEGQNLLAQRRGGLDARLGSIRERLNKAQAEADAKANTARGKFADFQAAAAAAGQQRASAVAQQADVLQKAIRSARRAWVSSGQADVLSAAVASAAEAFGAASAAANRSAAEALRDAAKKFGTVVATPAAEHTDVRPDALAPPERLDRARTGSVRMLRRAVWKRWYLPGLATLERTGIANALAAQNAWYEQAVKQAEQSVRGVLDGRLADVARAAQSEQERIRVETNFLAEEAEAAALAQHLPTLANARERLEEVSKEARRLADS